jgi:polyhydroxybutyrate depolymerase
LHGDDRMSDMAASSSSVVRTRRVCRTPHQRALCACSGRIDVCIVARVRPLLFVALVACGGSHGPALGDDDASIDAAPSPPDADPCGLRGGPRGLQHRDADVAGLHRTWLVYLPDTPPAQPVPVVLVFHGYTMSGQLMHDITDYTAIADAQGVALAFPDGQGGPNSLGAPWNVGTGVCTSYEGTPPDAPGDDFALIDAMKADISADQCIDRQHVFVTGFSMGGYFSHHVGCNRSDIRAVAPHSGGTHDLAGCPEAHKPIIIFHGDADPVIPASCADPHASQVAGTMPSADAWAMHNGCALTTTTQTVTNGTCYVYDGCPTGGQVELCTFAGMGHCWAGGDASAGIYSCPNSASATMLEWQFFQQYAWQ